MAVKKQIAVVEVMCNTKQAVQMLDEYKRLATDTLTKIETKTKELNALKAKGAKATDQEKDRMKQLAKEIKAEEDPEKKKELAEARKKEYNDLFCNPYNAAKYGYIDDVIEPRNTRFRIIRALEQLSTKKLSNPAKKHDNLPL